MGKLPDYGMHSLNGAVRLKVEVMTLGCNIKQIKIIQWLFYDINQHYSSDSRW